MKNSIKDYLKMLPLILYPYMYLVFLAAVSLFADDSETAFNICAVLAAAYNILTIAEAIVYSVSTAKGKRRAYQAAKINLAVKALQIPAYTFHFLLGLAGSFMSVWGIGFVLWAIFIDVVTIALTGTAAIGLSIRMYKENIITKKAAVINAILAYIFCIDVIMAAINVFKTRKYQ